MVVVIEVALNWNRVRFDATLRCAGKLGLRVC